VCACARERVKEWVGCLTLRPVSVYIQVWNEGLGNSEEGEGKKTQSKMENIKKTRS